ncbi:MAG TPA: hypothetical protein VN376_01290 [Longilinea sp.]|nr:hypothetical protein [Longilinea sp.]
MNDMREIRFVATNFSNLQGLKAVPLGILLVLVSLWANSLDHAAGFTDLLVPILEALGTFTLIIVIDRYYRRTFGRVQRTPESLRLEGLISVIGGVIALGAVWLDMTRTLPLSLVGLVFAAGLLADYVRITWLVKGRFLLYYPIGALIMAVMSILPLIGLPEWWHACGFVSQMIGITIVIGILSIIAGFWGHIYLVRTLSPVTEEK